MKSHYNFQKESDHLNMIVSEYEFTDFITYLTIIFAKCESEGIFKIILNALNVEGIDVPTLERYFLGVEAAAKLNYKVKLALVWHKEYLNHFGEIVANNRGGQVGVFGSVEAARKWLLHNIKE